MVKQAGIGLRGREGRSTEQASILLDIHSIRQGLGHVDIG